MCAQKIMKSSVGFSFQSHLITLALHLLFSLQIDWGHRSPQCGSQGHGTWLFSLLVAPGFSSKFCWLLKVSWECFFFFYYLKRFVENVLFLLYIFNEFNRKAIWVWSCPCGKVFNYIFVWVDLGLLKVLYFLWEFW